MGDGRTSHDVKDDDHLLDGAVNTTAPG